MRSELYAFSVSQSASPQTRNIYNFTLGTWDDEKRIAYIQSRVDSDEGLPDLDKAQFLRYRWEHGKSVSEYLREWEIADDLRELCEGLADATGDDTYRNLLETTLNDY